MTQNQRSGKLAVILHAAVADSTDRARQDERLVHERIPVTFRRLRETINKYQDHAREPQGGSLLAKFGRASDAAAALSFQPL